MLNVVYHQQYLNYDFGSDHPLRPERALQFIKLLKRLRIQHKILAPKRAIDKDLLLVHSHDYLERVKRLAKKHGSLSVDTPVNPRILEAAYYCVGGSILTLELALKGKRVINLAGGWHHAGISDSSGFCIFNDHSIAIKKLQKEKRVKKAMIYDLDVHAGQGTMEIFSKDPTVFTISIHQDPHTLYPGTGFVWQAGEDKGKGYNLNVCLPPDTSEHEYLIALDNVLPLAKKFKPEVVVLVLGVDTFREDPLARINLEVESYERIGERFKKFLRLAVLCAGGYSKKTPELWLSFLKGFL